MNALLLALFISMFSISSFAANFPSNYIGSKLGVYSPQSNDLNDYDSGLNGEAFIGHQFNPYIAAEIGVGYFLTKGPSGEYLGRITGDIWNGTFEVSAMPLTTTFLGIKPLGRGEIFLGGGIGAYFSKIKAKMTTSGHPSQSIESNDTPIGIHLRTGGNYKLTEKIYVGCDLQYILAKTTFSKSIGGFSYSRDFNLNGITTSAKIFYRF